MEDLKLQITGDGSHSVLSERFNALYHSKHGAIQESMHVFIQSGLYYKLEEKKEISILEMGFGTGLNLLLTYIESEKLDIDIKYETIEAFPYPHTSVKDLNYLELLDRNNLSTVFQQVHDSDWGFSHRINSNFSYTKLKAKIEDTLLENKYDLVYYDAFAPLTQEELWTPEIFQHIANSLNDQAILVSYCAKGSFKRALQAAGFIIEKIPGPPGKREMIRARFDENPHSEE